MKDTSTTTTVSGSASDVGALGVTAARASERSGRVVTTVAPGPGPALAWIRRRFAGGLALLGLAGIGIAVVSSSALVEVHIDGEMQAVRAYGGDVGDVIARLPVELGPHDAVRPALDTPIDDGLQVDVARAVRVDVHVDGEFVDQVVAPVDSVAAVLAHAGLEDVRALDARVVPTWTAPVDDGVRVAVWVPETLTLAVDGTTQTVTTFATDVEELLLERDVALGPDDLVSHDLTTSLEQVDHLQVARVDERVETEEVVLDHDEIVRPTTELPAGETRVESEGRDGLRLDRYRVVVVDGEVAERELLGEEIAIEPEARVVLRGIFEVRTENGMVAADDPVWDRLARCESRGNWSLVSGNGLYFGGLQFHPATWRSVGGTGMPHEHPREVQIEMARRLQARSGWGQWPACASALGLR